jgi:hypothetical protein
MKNYLPQRHKEEDKKCTSLLTSTLFYERQCMVSIRQKLREMHIKFDRYDLRKRFSCKVSS